MSNDVPPSRDLVWAQEPATFGLVFMPVREARRIVAVIGAVAEARSLGELRAAYQRLPEPEIKGWIEYLEEGQPPGVDVPFCVTETSRPCDGDWPVMPAQQMLDWFPMEILRENDESGSTTFNGETLFLHPLNAEHIVAELEARGYRCRRDDQFMKDYFQGLM